MSSHRCVSSLRPSYGRDPRSVGIARRASRPITMQGACWSNERCARLLELAMQSAQAQCRRTAGAVRRSDHARLRPPMRLRPRREKSCKVVRSGIESQRCRARGCYGSAWRATNVRLKHRRQSSVACAPAISRSARACAREHFCNWHSAVRTAIFVCQSRGQRVSISARWIRDDLRGTWPIANETASPPAPRATPASAPTSAAWRRGSPARASSASISTAPGMPPSWRRRSAASRARS